MAESSLVQVQASVRTSHFEHDIVNNILILSGLSAKFIEAGGADLIIIYNSGRFRMAGRGSLAGLMPYGNANDVVLEMVHPHPPTMHFHSPPFPSNLLLLTYTTGPLHVSN
jgi:predicted TIM-barrel enzyme